MTLATRCSACGTSFRVVQDQLKVSGGWVRCGRCNEVFNAIEGLYEVGSPLSEPATRRPIAPADMPETQVASREAMAPSQPPSPPPAAPPPAPPPPPPPPPAPPPPPIPESQPAPPAAPRPEPEFATEPADEAAAAPVEAEAPIDDALPDLPAIADEAPVDRRHDMQPGAADPTPRPVIHEVPVGADDAVDSHVPSELIGSTLTPDADDLLVPSPADEWRGDDWPEREPTPSFIVAAERAARRRRPRSRLAWGSACALLLLVLASQATLAYRDVVAARWPGSRAALVQVCSGFGCRIEPLRHIAALSVEASGLQQVGSATVYTLSVGLRNRSEIELMVPALDLVLTDSTGRTIARRVLTMADLGRPSRSLTPGAETSGQVTLSTENQRVSGYTIEIFYP